MKTAETKKKCELLKTSWTYQTTEYFKKSTLHGMRYINEDGRPFCEKFMWFTFISVGGVATLIIIVSLWEKFQIHPTITGLDTDYHNWDVPFPTVSLCPTDPVNNTAVTEYVEQTWPNAPDEMKAVYIEFVTKVANISYNNLNRFLTFNGTKTVSIPAADFKSILERVVTKCENFIHDCFFKGQAVNCCKVLKPLLTEVGFCLVFNSMHAGAIKDTDSSEAEFKLEYVHETDIDWSLHMSIENENMLKPVRVYLHSTEDLPIIDINPQHIWNQKIQSIKFSPKDTYTTKGARQLSIQQRKCVFEDEIELLTSDTYTYQSCMMQCHMELARRLCKCVPFFYQKIDGFMTCELQGLQCLAKHADKLWSVRCPCELGCSNTVYEVEKLTGVENEKMANHLTVAFASWPTVRYKREVVFGWVDLLVAFGGIAGLFMGFSLLSGVEIIYYFTMRAICMVYHEKEELQKLQEEYEKAAKPPLDLQLTPTFMRNKIHSPNKNISVAITRVQPLNKHFSATIQPVSTLSHRVNKGLGQNVRPVYTQFEFLP